MKAVLSDTRVVDLSVPLSPEHPCGWPGHPSLRVESHWFEDPQAPYAHRVIELDEHTGTHFDAPAHFIPAEGSDFYGGSGRHITSDEIPLDAFLGPARVIDVRGVHGDIPGQSPWIDVSRVQAHVERCGPIAPGDVVLFHTGWSDARYVAGAAGNEFVSAPLSGELAGWPAPAPDTIKMLAEAGVRAIGVDTPTLGAIQDSFGPHLAALEAGLVVVEELIGLAELPEVGALFIFLPLRLVGGTGAPGRAVAFIGGDQT